MKKRKFVVLSTLLLYMLLLPFRLEAQQEQKQKYQSAKFIYMSSLGYSIGVGQIKFEGRSITNDVFTISLSQLLAYQFNNYVFTGITAGLDIWNRTAFIPITATIGISFMDKKISPFIYLNGGYSFKWYVNSQPEHTTKVIKGGAPGIYLESGLGVRFIMFPKLSIIFMLEYKAQQSTIQYSVIEPGETDFSNYSTNRTQKIFYHFPGAKLSFLF